MFSHFTDERNKFSEAFAKVPQPDVAGKGLSPLNAINRDLSDVGEEGR